MNKELQVTTIDFIDNYDFIMKWKEMTNQQEEFNIRIPGCGTFINCKVIPEANGYTINYDEYKEE